MENEILAVLAVLGGAMAVFSIRQVIKLERDTQKHEQLQQKHNALRAALSHEQDEKQRLQMRLQGEEWRHKRLRENLKELAGDSEPLQS